MVIFLKRKLIYVCGRNQPIWPWIEPDCVGTQHKYRRRRLLPCAWKANCICRQNKAGRVVGAIMAQAEGRWFGLSNTFINYDESPLQFTSNQRPLTVTQHWSPLAKWFSWPVASHTAKELATWDLAAVGIIAPVAHSWISHIWNSVVNWVASRLTDTWGERLLRGSWNEEV